MISDHNEDDIKTIKLGARGIRLSPLPHYQSLQCEVTDSSTVVVNEAAKAVKERAVHRLTLEDSYGYYLNQRYVAKD